MKTARTGIELVRKGFKNRLSSYEKAVLYITEAAGRRRTDVLSSIKARDFRDAYWMLHWMHAFIGVAEQASHRALFCLYWGNIYATGGGRSARARDAAVDAYREAAAWLEGLRRLERETGAPLTPLLEYFGPSIAPLIPDFFTKETDEPCFEENYRILRSIWERTGADDPQGTEDAVRGGRS